MSGQGRCVLLAGFAPFDGEAVNPSWEAVAMLAGESVAGLPVETRRLPVVFGVADRALEAAIAELRPALTLLVGLAGGRAAVSVERVALNLIDARIADNEGRMPVDRPVAPGGPAAHFATVPVKAVAAALAEAGIPAETSVNAGGFVCNHVFYSALDLAGRRHPAMAVGLLHVPYAPEQAARRGGTPSMAVETVAAALRIALATALAGGTSARPQPARADST